MRMFRFINLVLLLVISILLTACGGGGGSSTVVDNKTYTIGFTPLNSNFQIGTIGMTPSTIGSGGASLLTVAVKENSTTAYSSATVSFTSSCLSSNKATITTTTPINGIYTAQYTNISCTGTDVVTATAIIGNRSITATGTLTISNTTNSAIELGFIDANNGFHKDRIAISPTILSSNAIANLRVNLRDSATLTAYQGTATVTFSGDCLATTSADISTTTNPSAGVYTATYTDKGCTGNKNIYAQATLSSGTLSATEAITMSNTATNVQMGLCSAEPCSSSNFTNGTLKLNSTQLVSGNLSAGGQVNISGWLWDGASTYNYIVPITLTSACAASTPPRATLTTTTASNGSFITTYKDISCGGNDIVYASATINGSNLQANVTVPVLSDAVGSITFADATPATMGLKGTGLNEQSTVRFLVKGGGTGLPLANKTVNFLLSTQAGGITFGNGSTTATAQTDTDGYATIIVRSGTTPTPVRVIASINTTINGSATTLTTQSDQLVISTTLPDQVHFSLSAEKYNLEAWSYDGEITNVVTRLADQFGNPVPDGTTVYFTTEGGSIQPSCNTTDGACSVAWTSQNPRPAAIGANNAGRATILAYALGVESFIDSDNNNIFSNGDTFGSSDRAVSTYQRRDMEAPYRDDNMDYSPQVTEFRPPLLPGGTFSPDGAYNGVICTATNPAPQIQCSSQKNIYVFGNIELIMAKSYALGMTRDTSTLAIFKCNGTDYKSSEKCTPDNVNVNGNEIIITLADENGNALPSGTSVQVAYLARTTAYVGTLAGDTNITINATEVNSRTLTVNLTPDYTAIDGIIEVTVTTPKQNISTATLLMKP
jgi:hypothetical protein